MKFYWYMLMIVAMCAPLSAQDAPLIGADKSVVINSPNKFARDRKVLLQVSGLDGLKARLKWWVRSNDGKDPPDYEVFNDGKTCAVWAPPGNYEALVTVGVIEGTDVLWFDVEHKFVVGDGPAPPNPPNPPNPPDPPTPPANDFGDVVGKVKELAGPIKDPTNKAEAAKIIAAAYRKHGALAVKGEYKDQNILADATAAEFVYELGLNRYVRWKPMMSRLRDHMSQLIKDGKLKDGDMKQWGALWEEYAKGFDAVAKEEGGTRGQAN